MQCIYSAAYNVVGGLEASQLSLVVNIFVMISFLLQ